MSLPPGPSTPAFLQTWAWVRRPTALLDDCRERYGTRFTLKFPRGRRLVMLADPEDVKAVFSGPTDVFLSGRANQTFKPFAGDHSLFVLDLDAHQRHRRLLMPPFQGERMRAYGSLIRDVTLRSIERWPVGRPFPIVDRMHAVTLEVIIRAVFGVSEDAAVERLGGLLERLAKCAPAILLFFPWLQRDLGPLSPWGRFVRARRAVTEVLLAEIARARQGADGREDILAKLIEEGSKRGDPMSDAEVCDELLTLLGAGHETTTASLAWAFQWILGTPAALDRALAELRDVAGEAPLDPACVPRLRWLDACVYEALRISPVIPIALRWLAKTTSIGGCEMPEGTVVCPCAYLVQRDAAIFPEPRTFKPERFEGRRPSPFEWFPFGGGSRTCIGMAFALYEMNVVLATVLQRARLRLVDPPSERLRRRGLFLAPRDGARVVYEGPR